MTPFDLAPLVLSLKVALAALIVVVLAGVGAARALAGREFRGRDLLEGLLMLPLVLPPVVTGFGLLVLIGRGGPVGRGLEKLGLSLLFTPGAAVLASACVAFPLMYQSARASFAGVDPQLEAAARGLGASTWRVLWTVTLPLSWPGLCAGVALSFARALGEFGATIMVAGNIAGLTTTAPLALFSAAESGDLRTAGFYALALGGINLALLAGVNAWARRARRRWSARSGEFKHHEHNIDRLRARQAQGEEASSASTCARLRSDAVAFGHGTENGARPGEARAAGVGGGEPARGNGRHRA